MRTNEVYHMIACEVIGCAIDDLRRLPKPKARPYEWRRYLDAVLWLGSTGAAVYFDAVDIDQKQALLATKWASHAKRVLDTTPLPRWHRLTWRERRLLESGIAALEG